MVLLVDFDRFVEESKRLVPGGIAYVSNLAGRTQATVGDPRTGMIVSTMTDRTEQEVHDYFRSAGMESARGRWVPDEEAVEHDIHRPVWAAAVSYRSSEEKPGLWMDASFSRPSDSDVLEAMYSEFKEQGELEDIEFEEFVRLADVNVIVVGPDELQRHAREKLT